MQASSGEGPEAVPQPPGKVVEFRRPPVAPTCPYCETKPVHISSQPFRMGPLTTVAFYCTDCGKLLGIQAIGMDAPQAPLIS